ncbi:acyltransferase family protein [Bacillus sp. JJ1566]|uniref:acyltransferase n=1 Tax=Bacillus sp. JJ1566 TaxID=3122961 RepID=UPI002FFD6A9D
MKRYFFLDWLRIFAIIGVVTIHVSAWTVAENLYNHPQSYWLVGNLFESLSRCSVPIFVMISGALLLRNDKTLTYKEFMQKRIGKIFVPLLSWSLIYYFYQVYRGHFTLSATEFGSMFLSNSISYHLWFMYMILGLYLVTPLLKILTRHASKRDIQYFLLLWFIISVFSKTTDYLFGIKINLELYFVMNYVGYFILGYYLSTYTISRKLQISSYIGAIIGLFATFSLTYIYTKSAGGALSEFWYEYHSPNVFLVSVGVFILFKSREESLSKPIPMLFQWINQTSFGIYLIHILVMSLFMESIFNKIYYNLHPIISIPLNVAIVITISLIAVIIIRRIPVIKKIIP